MFQLQCPPWLVGRECWAHKQAQSWGLGITAFVPTVCFLQARQRSWWHEGDCWKVFVCAFSFGHISPANPFSPVFGYWIHQQKCSTDARTVKICSKSDSDGIFLSDPNPSALCYTVLYPVMRIDEQLCSAEIQWEESLWRPLSCPTVQFIIKDLNPWIQELLKDGTGSNSWKHIDSTTKEASQKTST